MNRQETREFLFEEGKDQTDIRLDDETIAIVSYKAPDGRTVEVEYNSANHEEGKDYIITPVRDKQPLKLIIDDAFENDYPLAEENLLGIRADLEMLAEKNLPIEEFTEKLDILVETYEQLEMSDDYEA